ncbi:hypothetical protein QTP88_006111 [Uroleucon formosanum]
MPAIVANELQDMQLRSAHVTDESLESTRRMIELCEGTKEAAIKALVELDDQGEKMDRIEEGMDQINADMKEAEKNLTGMEKCCGICVVPCNKSTSFKEDEGTWKGNEDGKVINKQPQRVIEGPNITPQGGYIVKITNDARETEMDENLGQVNTMIGNLRNMALDMGSELENQNQQIEKISTKAIHTAIKDVWPTTNLKACRFHLGQAWFRKMQSLGLAKPYMKPGEMSEYLKLFFGLPFLRPDEVDDCFVTDIMALLPPNNSKLNAFTDYILEVYESRLQVDLTINSNLFSEFVLLHYINLYVWQRIHLKFGVASLLDKGKKSPEKSKPERYLPINEAAVTESISTGIGYTKLSELCATMDISCMASCTFILVQGFINKRIHDVAEIQMKIAGDEERR